MICSFSFIHRCVPANINHNDNNNNNVRCGPCRLTVPVVKDVMKQFSGELDVVEVCTDDLAEVAEEAGIVSIPTIQFYYDGASLETHSIVGCVAKSVLSNAVQKVIEDVAQIRQANKR